MGSFTKLLQICKLTATHWRQAKNIFKSVFKLNYLNLTCMLVNLSQCGYNEIPLKIVKFKYIPVRLIMIDINIRMFSNAIT